MFNVWRVTKPILNCAADVMWSTWFLMWLYHLRVWPVEFWFAVVTDQPEVLCCQFPYHIDTHILVSTYPTLCPWPRLLLGFPLLLTRRLALCTTFVVRFQLDFGPRCALCELSPYSVQFEFFATQRLCSHDVALNMKKSILSFGFSTNHSHRVVSSLNRWGWQARRLCIASLRLFWFPISCSSPSRSLRNQGHRLA